MKEWKTNNETYGSSYGISNSLPKKIIGKSTAHYLESLDKGNFIREEQNIAKRERHGLFTQPLGLAPGDPYKDPEIKQPEKRFQVNQRLQQKVAPEVFSNPGTISLHDPYKDSFRANQLYIKQKGDLSIHDRAFVAGGKQKLIKHAQFEHVKEFNDKQFHTRDENGKVITSKKNLYTNKMRKGYGSTGIEHLFSSYPYKGYPQEDGREKDQQEKMAHKAKIATPFKSTSHPNTTFTKDRAIYNKNEPYHEKKEDLTYREKSLNQWRYNNPNKKGHHGTFSDFPPYIEQGEREKNQIQTTKPWIPNFNGTSKGVGQTLNRPCIPSSQMMISEIKRAGE